jgi:glutamate mutase epsilon subunit
VELGSRYQRQRKNEMRTAAIIFFLVTFTTANAQYSKSMIAQDKQLHFVCGYSIGFNTSICVLNQKPLNSLVWTVAVTSTIAIGKEWYDIKRGTPEVMDIVYTVGGGLIGYGVVQALKFIPEKKRVILARGNYKGIRIVI